MDEQKELEHTANKEYYIFCDRKKVRLSNPSNMNRDRLSEMIMDIFGNPDKYKSVTIETQKVSLTDADEDDNIRLEKTAFTPTNNPYLTALQNIPENG